MQLQNEFNFQADSNEAGYGQWIAVRREAAGVIAQKMGLPLGRPVEVWLSGGVRLRGTLRLLHEVLFIEEEKAQSIPLKVDGVSFLYSEMESCVRVD